MAIDRIFGGEYQTAIYRCFNPIKLDLNQFDISDLPNLGDSSTAAINYYSFQVNVPELKMEKISEWKRDI